MAEFNLTPVFRMEMFIDAIINGTTPPVPQFREEFYFAKVAGMDVELPTPITRREFYLAKYAGMNVDLPVPVTRDEMYLALACGLGVEPPEPVFRDEYWLYELSGGGKWSWKTVSGSMIHITDAVFFPMQKCEVTLEPIQAGSGDPSPDNVRPITGWTGCEVKRTGINVWDEEWENGYYNRTKGNKAGNSDTSYFRSKNFIPVKPNTQYYIVLPSVHASNNTWFSILTYGSQKEYLSYTHQTGSYYLLTTGTRTYYLTFYCEVGTTGATYQNDISFNYPSTDTSYHAYSGTTLSVTFPDSVGTVYGGTYDFVSGDGESKMAIVDLGTLTWTYQSSNTRFYSDELENIIKKPAVFSDAANAISSHYKIVSWGDFSSANDVIAVATSGNIFIRDTRYTDKASLTAALSGVQFVFELADSVDFILTPQQISTRAGENNVWGDGNIEMTYKAKS